MATSPVSKIDRYAHMNLDNLNYMYFNVAF